MGTSAVIRTSGMGGSVQGVECKIHTALEYGPSAVVQIKLRDEAMEVVYREKLLFQFPPPVFALSKVLNWDRKSINVSASVMPGFDPRGLYPKECQDMAFFDWVEDALLVGVYDGHGKFGAEIVKLCRKFTLQHFRSHAAAWKADPESYLFTLTKECDRELSKAEHGIDVRVSGSTMVLYLIRPGKVVSASVGDSRIVLATSKPFKAPKPHERGEDREVLERVKRRRSVSIDKLVKAVQLTQDQKPEDEGEVQRITRMGGVVHRLMDEFGNDVGPWRVWKQFTNGPGLAMSRSLGDSMGKEVGVISDPLIFVHEIESSDDFFIVSATDGVWDVMENQEVVDFVELFRAACRREVNGAEVTDYARPTNSTIAQLLCEEARVRWLAIVEEEDVLIDDISCVVLELRDSHLKLSTALNRAPVPFLDVSGAIEKVGTSVPRSQVRVRDPRRGSVTEELVHNVPQT